MNVFADAVAKMRRRVGFVRRFIFCEARVAINAKHRTAIRARVGVELLANFFQVIGEVGDETQQRLFDVIFVTWLIFLKPLFAIVRRQFAQELE